MALATLALAFCGCEPARMGTLDEEKDPLFVEATSRRNAGDVPGAIQLFERTLQANPANASAHLELGLLYERPENDFAAAIYHFQKFLQLRPNSDRAEVVKEHSLACKQELAKSVLPASLPQTAEKELRDLLRKNEDLRRELETLRSQHTNALYALSTLARSAGPATAAAGTYSTRGTPPEGRVGGPQAPSAGRKHVIAKSETLSSIARRYAVSLESLRGANPGVNERRLQVGQSLQIPER
jgi:LysM repeat protein